MKKLIFSCLTIAILASCSTSSTQNSISKDSENQNEVSSEELATVLPNRSMKMEIDGMVCEMGCGAAIREELKNTGAVARCSFDFKGEDVTSDAIIEFDKDKISADKIGEIVSKLNDGQFTVGQISTETIEIETPDVKNVTTSSSSSDEAPIKVSSSTGIQLPNFLDLLSGILTH